MLAAKCGLTSTFVLSSVPAGAPMTAGIELGMDK
jgi:hypothetical protein